MTTYKQTTGGDIGLFSHKNIGIVLLCLSYISACLYIIFVVMGMFGVFWLDTHTTTVLSFLIFVLCIFLSFLAYLGERKRISKIADFLWNLWALIGAVLLSSDNLNIFAGNNTSSLSNFYHQLRSAPVCETAFFSLLVLITSVRFSFAFGGFFRDLFPCKLQRQ